MVIRLFRKIAGLNTTAGRASMYFRRKKRIASLTVVKKLKLIWDIQV